MTDKVYPGLIVHAQSGLFEVETEEGLLTAELRGRLKQERLDTDVAALGDRVQVRDLGDGRGAIEEIEPRRSVLSRRTPAGDREQVIVANPDQAVFVFACRDPELNPRMLDRLLVAAEREQIPSLICANKIDLAEGEGCRSQFAPYDSLGYPVHMVSAKTGEGIDQLRSALAGRISVFAGPSGVGKTSLLNAIQPGLALRTGEVRQQTRKGKHTTVSLKLVPLQEGGYVADTPGMKAFALWDIEPEELDAYFPEIRQRVADCSFSDCSHLHEPGCAVLAAVESGEISPDRYDSYCRMRLGED
ncbi:MAG: ribosome small subunit-dependent GTPase A [Anaerolineales bacterium]